jgi:hypothetical protein
MKYVLIVLGALVLCGCASSPRPAAFGGNQALSADCREISGKYLNTSSHSTSQPPESLSALLARTVENHSVASVPVSFTLGYPASRVLRISYFDLKGVEVGQIDLREQLSQYRCAEGVLEIASGVQRLFAGGSETLSFSRTTGNYLMIRRSSMKFAPSEAAGGLLLPGMHEDWYVFTPI